MPTLQVRELPEDVYNQLSYLAERSIEVSRSRRLSC
jgi:hypothetical protein